jgi:hypothetical protein
MQGDLGKRLRGFGTRFLDALFHFTLVLDLLLDPCQFAADPVAIGLDLGQDVGRLYMLASAGFDLGLGMALFREHFLQLQFGIG